MIVPTASGRIEKSLEGYRVLRSSADLSLHFKAEAAKHRFCET